MIKLRLYLALFLLIGAIIAWPITQLTVAKDEPKFTLGLSWLAIILTAADLVSTTHVSKQKEK